VFTSQFISVYPVLSTAQKSTKDIINIITIFGSGPLFGLITGMGMVIILRAINNNSSIKSSSG